MKYEKNFYQIKSNITIFNLLKKEKETIGYYNLPYKDTTHIKEYAKTIQQKHIIIIGVGGSSLGAKAIYDFLLPSNDYDKKLHFLDSTDPIDINYKLKHINIDNSHFVIISKSGNTIETISIFKYINSLIKINSSNCTIISENKTKLYTFAKVNSIKIFSLDENIGGRFSVFSVVALVPLAIIGVDIDDLLEGARKINDSFFEKSEFYESIIQKARFLVENKNRFNINIIFSYSSSLESFNKWYIQLWGESLGKININGTRQALTPIGLIGPIDQHSFLQLIIEGVRDKTVTFVKIENLNNKTKISKNTINGFDDLVSINDLEFSYLLNKQADATIQSIQEQKDIPCDVLTIKEVKEYDIAQLMYAYQLLTSCIGKFLQINTYNQPSVEYGKNILKDMLKN